GAQLPDVVGGNTHGSDTRGHGFAYAVRSAVERILAGYRYLGGVDLFQVANLHQFGKGRPLAGCMAGHTACSAFSVWISCAVNPISARMASVCWPSTGGGASTAGGSPSSLMPVRSTLMSRSTPGASLKVATMPRPAICGCCN